MHHEHTGNCCGAESVTVHEHHHAVLPLGHICTGACMHDAAEANALAMLREQQAIIEQLQSRAFDTSPVVKDKLKKPRRKRSAQSILDMAQPATTA